VDEQTPLLYILRNDLELNGPQFGCGLAQCGACAVLIDGRPVPSCVLPAGNVIDVPITTLEGLNEVSGPGALAQAFIDEQAGQCGYCLNGMLIWSKALLDRDPDPSEDAIKQALANVLCRCGCHNRIVRAVRRAAAAAAR
jgi:nicotinate dehydrogenase subunit A